jgi:hypothetical protein
MQRKSVSSSSLSSIGYDSQKKILEVEFNHRGIYQYFDVPQDEYDDLMNASSHGSYFYHNIRDCYDYEKIR